MTSALLLDLLLVIRALIVIQVVQLPLQLVRDAAFDAFPRCTAKSLRQESRCSVLERRQMAVKQGIHMLLDDPLPSR